MLRKMITYSILAGSMAMLTAAQAKAEEKTQEADTIKIEKTIKDSSDSIQENIKEKPSKDGYNPTMLASEDILWILSDRTKEKELSLEFIINFARKTTEGINDNQKKAETIYQTLEDLGYRTIVSKIFGLDNNCVGRSAVFKHVAKELGMPAYLTLAPSHVFVRIDPDGKHNPEDEKDSINKGDINFEATLGYVLSDNFYRRKLNVSESSVKNKCYLNTLTEEQEKSIGYYRKGCIKREEGRFDEAVEEFTKAISLNSSDPELHLQRGYTFYMKGDHENARKDLNESLKLNPEFAEAHYTKGTIDFIEEKYDKANSNLEKALEIKPNFPEALLDKAMIYFEKGDTNMAIRYFEMSKKAGMATKDGIER